MTVRPAKTQDQPGHPPSLIRVFACTQWIANDPSFLHVDSEDSDQTGWMPRLIWVFSGRTTTFAGFVMRRFISRWARHSKTCKMIYATLRRLRSAYTSAQSNQRPCWVFVGYLSIWLLHRNRKDSSDFAYAQACLCLCCFCRFLLYPGSDYMHSNNKHLTNVWKKTVAAQSDDWPSTGCIRT